MLTNTLNKYQCSIIIVQRIVFLLSLFISSITFFIFLLRQIFVPDEPFSLGVLALKIILFFLPSAIFLLSEYELLNRNSHNMKFRKFYAANIAPIIVSASIIITLFICV